MFFFQNFMTYLIEILIFVRSWISSISRHFLNSKWKTRSQDFSTNEKQKDFYLIKLFLNIFFVDPNSCHPRVKVEFFKNFCFSGPPFSRGYKLPMLFDGVFKKVIKNVNMVIPEPLEVSTKDLSNHKLAQMVENWPTYVKSIVPPDQIFMFNSEAGDNCQLLN